MKANVNVGRQVAVAGATVVMLCSGCATQRMAPPLFSSAPPQDTLGKPSLLPVPKAPAPVSIPLTIRIPQHKTKVGPDNSIMRRGAIVKPGSSVVISVPASIYQRTQQTSGHGVADELGFRTDGYFNVLEQYIERGLIAAGFHVKDRAKFEAKLRDLRDSGDVVRRADSPYNAALANLQKELDAGKITREEYAEQALQLRDKLLDPSRSSRSREELTDISEVIRAAQDGDVMADYVLQVNELAVVHYTGTPLQLGIRPEVQEVLRKNPGLRLGSPGEEGAIPSTLKQPWAQARFNAKLIDVKTGSIDWIGEFTIESLAVLEDGVRIVIGIRKRPTNANVIIRGIESHNSNVGTAYRRAVEAKRSLDREYQNAMQKKSYYGTPQDESAVQSRRRRDVQRAEQIYSRALSDCRSVVQRKPRELGMDWDYAYDVDTPVVIPDLLRPRTEEEGRRLLQHVKDLGSKVTRDLLQTIKISAAQE